MPSYTRRPTKRELEERPTDPDAVRRAERIAYAHATPERRQTQAFKNLASRVEAEDEIGSLCRSPIACAVADAWAAISHIQDAYRIGPDLTKTLEAIEAVTCNSSLRKVKCNI